MTLLPMSPLVWAGSLLAGFLGALTGLGGGVVVVPLLVLVFGVDLRYAIGASLLSVVGTSSGAAAAYLRDGVSNIRVGMFLEIATTIGALVGAAVAAHAAKDAIAVVFGLVLLAAAATSLTRRTSQAGPSPAASRVARGRRTRRGDDLPGRDGQGMTMLRWSDGQVERFMAGLLRAGVYLSAALVLAGGAVHLARFRSEGWARPRWSLASRRSWCRTRRPMSAAARCTQTGR